MIHEREPCFVCERREREEGQILCRVCIAWAEAAKRNPRSQHTVLLSVEATARDAISLADFLRCYAPDYERRRWEQEVAELRDALNQALRGM